MKGFGEKQTSQKKQARKNNTTLSQEKIIHQAFKFHSQGNIQEAAKYYQYFINKGFNDHRVFSNYGVILKDLGRLKDAEISYRNAIELNPNFAEAHYNLGGILKDLGQLQEAELSTRKAIELNPDFAEAYYNLGGILKDLGQLQEAELSTRKAIELIPNFGIAHSSLGGILKDLGQLQEAELSTRKAIELIPDFTEAFSNLGNILKDLGQLQEAELSTRKAIELNPDFAEAFSNLGNILRDLGQLQEAELSTRKAIELNPDLIEAHKSLGYILLEKGEYDSALKYFSESAELLRGQKNQESNNSKFTQISKAKIDHDIEQFEYLASQGYERKKFIALIILYKKIAAEINWPSETQLISLSNHHQSLLHGSYNRLIHQIKVPTVKNEAINNSLNVAQITNDYFDHEFGLTYIDDFLSAKAIESLRQFLLGSTIWFDIKGGGYLGAYLTEGLANPLIIQIADELKKKFPQIFKDHTINQIWAYKYDSRAKHEDSSITGINVHADFAAVNVNFWITPQEANLNPDSGGLVVYDVEAPKDWDFKTYNRNVSKIREELKNSKGNTKVIPHNENRAVIFNSNLFHETDNYEFKEGYENRRINITMLFGNRINNEW
ncbi:tetratricopeptide repeat protein [Prochlorococcus marinus]|uniref:tetratricopeptide repeat protein n=1 Tax=Prochlorococcus marinus TaxID=1219 RepID=UPI0022B5AE26|nr:tetratricopeptide repeat protein [Prochlorococcus marinus]